MDKNRSISRKAKDENAARAPLRILRPPRLKTLSVSRPALEAGVIEAAISKRLTLVSAPSGYGKTTLLSEVYRILDDKDIVPIWISSASTDRDPARLDALLCQQFYAKLNLPYDDSADFIGLLAKVSPKKQIIVMIDNWNFVETQDTNQYFIRLLQETDEIANFILSTQKVLDLPIETWRLAGEVAEFTMQDLSFDDAQAWELLNTETDLDRTSQLDRLLERTEGWPAGVQLLRMALQQKTHEEVVLEFSGGRESVSNYLQETLFSQFDKDTQGFLCLLSYLEDISPELVEVILPEQDGAQKLEAIRRQNLFFNEISEGSSHFRFHSLVRDFLLARAKLFSPISGQEICVRACRFFEERGDEIRAIWYAVRSGNHEKALKLLDGYAESSLVAQGRIRLFTEWVSILLNEGADLSPSVSYWYRWCLVFTGRWEAAAELTHAGNKQRAAIIDAVIGAFSDDQPRMRDAVNKWNYVGEDADPFSFAVMYSAAAINMMSIGNYRDARIELSKAELSIRQTAGGFGRTWVNVLIVLAEIGSGKVNAALHTAEHAINEANRSLLPKAPAARMARMSSAVAKYYAGDDAGTIEDLGFANTERDDHTLPILSVIASAIAHELGVYWEKRRFEEHPPSVAIDLISEALMLERQVKTVSNTKKMIARINEFENKCQAASTIAGSTEDFSWLLPDLRDVLAIRSQITVGDLNAAAALISPAINRCQQSGRGLTEMRLLLLRCVVLFRQDKAPAALRVLLQQAEKAVSDGLFRPFLELQHMLQPMLPDLFKAGERIALGEDSVNWRRFCTMLGAQHTPTAMEATIKPIASLEKGFQITARESEILGFLDLGLSNAEIGQRMGISLPTVKWHLANLYSKLNVKNRASAVRFARDNGFA